MEFTLIRQFSLYVTENIVLLSWFGFAAVKRKHDHSNYKREYLIGAGLQFKGLVH